MLDKIENDGTNPVQPSRITVEAAIAYDDNMPNDAIN
jgi:hypothetical protein